MNEKGKSLEGETLNRSSSTQDAKVLRDVYDTIYERLHTLIPDLSSLKANDARVSKSEGFMDLHLDVLSREEGQMIIALHHAFEQNGDLVSDPDMEIRIYLIPDWHKAEALTYQDQFGYRQVYPEPNLVNVKAKKELNSFLAHWLKKCIEQGYSLTVDGGIGGE